MTGSLAATVTTCSVFTFTSNDGSLLLGFRDIDEVFFSVQDMLHTGGFEFQHEVS